MRFGVLGEVYVDRDGDVVALGGPQQRRLLALLLSERGRVVSTDRIVDALWADGDTPLGAAQSAMKYVSRLRAVLGESVIATVGSGYRLELDGHDCDVEEFEALIDEAEQDLPDAAVARYDAALQLWRGPPYGEFGDEWWALPEASRLAERRIAAEIARAAAQMAMGRHNRAIADLERVTLERPLDERPVRLLMQALHASGRQAEAMRVASAFRRRLADETGLDPSAELARLEAAIAGGDRPAGASLGRPLRGYTIHDAIGEGAHGRVYAATQPGTERRVAIKVIRPELADSPVFVQRFEAEARLVARLEHPHIVPLYDYWREPGGAYLVFRLLTGGTARDSVVSGGPWSLARVARLIEEVGSALMSAHGAGVTHNDVKASNVLLDDAGAAYLTDFGIAHTADGPRDVVSADIAGLAWMAWELLSGARSPAATSAVGAPALVVGAPTPTDALPSLVGRMPSVPDGLDAVLRRATEDGYESVAEFVLAWRAAVGNTDGQHSPIPSDFRRAAARQLARAATAGVNPYRGLRPFDEADAGAFYGRDRVVDDLSELLAAHRFVTIVGSSGSGKSSVVLAGLVPRLRADGIVVATMIPGERPADALATALRDVATLADADDVDATAGSLADVARRAGRLVVVVDQFEECWTRADQQERDDFLALADEVLADESVDVRFVTTVRADLLDRPLEHPTIGPLVGAGSYVLAPLSPAEMEEAIVQPAARVGVTFDDGVVADLAAEAVSHPGSLPLLQFTLTELYDQRRDAVIGRHALEGIGGLAGAIGRRAEEVYQGLDVERRDDARALFGRLVAPGRSAPDTRRRALLGELSTGMREVADVFVAARLLVADRDPATREPTVEVAHEALLVRWSRLVDWVDEDRRWLTQLQHLSVAARAWDDGGRLDTELYRGSRLEAAIEALDNDGRAASELERAFVEAGREARDAEIHAAIRTGRRLRRLLAAVAAALVVALVAGTVAVVQRREADNNAAEAEVQAERAEAAATAAQIEALVGRAESLRQTQRDTAALLAVEAYRLADTPRTRSALLATFTDNPTFYDARHLAGREGGVGIVMPDGASAYLVDDTGQLRPYELETGSLGDPLPAIGATSGGTSLLVASADGALLVQAWRANTARGPTTVGVFDTTTESLRLPPISVDGAVWSGVFTPNAADLALAIDEEARLVVVDVATGAERFSTPGVTVPPLGGEAGLEPQASAVGPTPRPPALALVGDELLLGAADGSLRAFDAVTFDLRRSIALAPDTLASIRPLDDGTLVTAGRLGISRIEPASGDVIWQHDQGLADIGDGAAGATCTHLTAIEQFGSFYCADAYGRLAEYDLDSGYATRVLDAQNGNTGPLWPARDGTELVSFGDNAAIVSRWRLDGSGPITHLVAPGHRVFSFNPTGDHALVERGEPFEGFPSQVIDVASGDVVRTIDGLINALWLDDDTVTGAMYNSAGYLEAARVDLPDGDVVGNGLIIDPIPAYAGMEIGKEQLLFRYSRGNTSTLRSLDPNSLEFGPPISVDGWFGSSISRTGHRIAAGTVRGVEIYDAVTGEQVDAIERNDLRSVFITLTDQLFVGSLAGELTMYDLDSLEPIRTFGGSRGVMTLVHGTADGSLIATHGGDHRVILYDVATGERIGTPITVADGEWNASALSIDGRWLSVGGEPGDGQNASKIWDLDPSSWVAGACRVAGRNLTREEWTSNIGNLAPYRATCPNLPTDA
jgi:DNA-binding SARP family transcriptional activator/tRNA A-37 threonylcarbamoyl transferase component Bud32/WD40 repeat protein